MDLRVGVAARRHATAILVVAGLLLMHGLSGPSGLTCERAMPLAGGDSWRMLAMAAAGSERAAPMAAFASEGASGMTGAHCCIPEGPRPTVMPHAGTASLPPGVPEAEGATSVRLAAARSRARAGPSRHETCVSQE